MEIEAVLRRVRAEFVEMPGLRLTPAQATRLWGLEQDACHVVINALIAFITIAAAVFFFVVRPINALMARRKTGLDTESETRPCSECLSEIPREARRCAFCTSPQAVAA